MSTTKHQNGPVASDNEAARPADAPNASDIMNRRVQTVEADMDLNDVVAFLLKHQLSNAPVVRREGTKKVLLGFLSEADCLEHLANSMFYGNPCPPQTAGTMMKRHPVCVGPDQDLFSLASIFTNHGLRHLPVVDGEELVGIVSRRDVLASLQQHLSEWTKTRDRDRFPVDLHQIMNIRFLSR